MKPFFAFASTLILAFLPAVLSAEGSSTVVFSSDPEERYFTDSSGQVLLSDGSLVLIGTFLHPELVTEALPFSDVTAFAGWQQFGEAAIESIGSDGGKLTGQVSNTTNPDAFSDKQIYLWVFNGPTIFDSTQYGIFTVGGVGSEWVFARSGVASVTTIRLNDDGVSALQGGVNGDILSLTQIIPEPAVYAALLGGAGLAMVALRRRQKRVR